MKIGFRVSKGISSLALATVSPIISLNIPIDSRFFEPIDDPYGEVLMKKAYKLLAIPILPPSENIKLQYPYGVIVSINKSNGDFNTEDTENILEYGRDRTSVV